jgi:hypothetical protein
VKHHARVVQALEADDYGVQRASLDCLQHRFASPNAISALQKTRPESGIYCRFASQIYMANSEHKQVIALLD